MRPSKSFLLGVIVILLTLAILMVLPFLQFFLLAVMLTYLLLPIQRRIESHLGPALGAAVIVLLATIAILLPVLYFLSIAVVEAVSLVRAVRSGEVTLVNQEERIEDITGFEVDITQQIQSAVSGLEITSVVGVVDTLAHVLLGIGLTLFLVYYFLKDRKRFMHWLRRSAPLEDDVQDNLYTQIDGIMRAVLLGHVLVAFVQGILAGIGLVFVGIPNATLWTVVMIVLSLLPLIGSFLVWGPATIYLFLEGEPVLAAFLFFWGAIVVGVSDDYLRPIVVDRYARVNPSVIIIGVFGGLYLLGPMGIFFGPVIIGMLRGSLDVFRDEFETLD